MQDEVKAQTLPHIVSATSGLSLHLLPGCWSAFVQTPTSSCSLVELDASMPETLRKSITLLRQLVSEGKAPFVFVLYALVAFVTDALRSNMSLDKLPDLVVSLDTPLSALLQGAFCCFDNRNKSMANWAKTGSILVDSIVFVSGTML